MRYTDHDTRVKARSRSAEELKERFPRRWREAGTTKDGVDYPAGVPGVEVGRGRHVAPERCITTHGARVRRGKRGTDLEGKFLVRDATGRERRENLFADEQETADVRRERTTTDVDPS